MLTIALHLLSAWILGLFGFDTMFIGGVDELFNLDITKTGYYTVFAIFGMIKSLIVSPITLNNNKNKSDNSFESAWNKAVENAFNNRNR